ncbi:MAG: ABC transporter permease [Planctomycetes bacterium]|nr:ABC transporter permease [Planctomycetota bacterium]
MKALAIARLTVRESMRRRSLVVVGALWAVLAALTFARPAIAGGHRVQVAFSQNLWLASFFTVLLGVFLAAPSIPADLEERRIFTILSKPVRSWDYFLGKFLGFAAFLGAILAAYLALFSVLVAVAFRDLSAEEKETYFHARSRREAVELQVGSLDEGASLPAAAAGGAEFVVVDDAHPSARWVFEGLDPDRLPPGPIAGQARLRFRSEGGGSPFSVRCRLKLLERATGGEESREYEVARGRPLEFQFPRELLTREGDLELVLERVTDGEIFVVQRESAVLYSSREHYVTNLAKAIFVVYLEVLVVLAVALAGSAFLSGPVAILLSLFVYLVGHLLAVIRSFARAMMSSPEVVREAVGAIFRPDAGHHHGPAASEEPGWQLRLASRGLSAFCDVCPDFGRFAVSERVSGGVSLSWSEIFRLSPSPGEGGPVEYAALYAGLAILAGWLLFHFTDVERGEGPVLRLLSRLRSRPRKAPP